MKPPASACLLLIALPVGADTLRVAVASNFSAAARSIARAFGATGKHYAQIRHGAPFDVFPATGCTPGEVGRPVGLTPLSVGQWQRPS